MDLAAGPGWTMVVAMARNEVIGAEGGLPWRLSSDLQRFKKLTMGHCLVMGRKTFESIGRPLPGRQTVVLSRRKLDLPDGVASVSDLDAVEKLVEPERLVMVVGGAQVYEAAIPLCDSIWLTRVQADVCGDTKFPSVDWSKWKLCCEENTVQGPRDDWDTAFQVWKRA